MRLLVEAGADRSAKDYKWKRTALSYANQHGDDAIQAILRG